MHWGSRIPVVAACFWLCHCAMPPRYGYDRDRGDWKGGVGHVAGKRKVATHISDKNLDAIVRPWLGTPYAYGGQSKSGIDCSGFVRVVMRAYRKVELPRSSAQAYKKGSKVQKTDLRIGDVVFFGSMWGIDHSGIWVGQGRFVHASTSNGVMFSALDTDPYWSGRFQGARRFD